MKVLTSSLADIFRGDEAVKKTYKSYSQFAKFCGTGTCKHGFSSYGGHYTDTCSDCKMWDRTVAKAIDNDLEEISLSLEALDKTYFADFEEAININLWNAETFRREESVPFISAFLQFIESKHRNRPAGEDIGFLEAACIEKVKTGTLPEVQGYSLHWEIRNVMNSFIEGLGPRAYPEKGTLYLEADHKDPDRKQASKQASKQANVPHVGGFGFIFRAIAPAPLTHGDVLLGVFIRASLPRPP